MNVRGTAARQAYAEALATLSAFAPIIVAKVAAFNITATPLRARIAVIASGALALIMGFVVALSSKARRQRQLAQGRFRDAGVNVLGVANPLRYERL